MRINYAIVFVSDMKQAVAFYRDVMGLPLKFETPGWTEFATEGATRPATDRDVRRAHRRLPGSRRA
jgi:catechol 2,3-dioxygenase-like lactoylglutathione lyase family enzyme